MSTTQPIRSKQLLHDFKDYYLIKQPNFRNYTLILIGLNTALRINDILHVYAQGNNLFNRRWQDYFTMRNQGVNFLVGVGAKF